MSGYRYATLLCRGLASVQATSARLKNVPRVLYGTLLGRVTTAQLQYPAQPQRHKSVGKWWW